MARHVRSVLFFALILHHLEHIKRHRLRPVCTECAGIDGSHECSRNTASNHSSETETAGRLPRKQRAPRSALFRLKIEKTVYNCIYTIFLTQTQLQLLQTVGYPVPEKIGTKVTRQKMSMRVAEERFGVPRSTLCNWKKASMNGIFKLFCL